MKPVFGFVMLAGLLLFGADGATDAAKKKMAAGKYEEAVTDLDAAYQKNPKSAELKKALAGAHFAQGEATMKNEQLPPMRKYPAALRAFRKTVALDPAHAGAKDNIKAIEDVYKSMGRPVPQ
jgi:tetratricopeptide (TPR) repeat protein